MARVKVNFGDVQDFEALPEGMYEAIIEKIEYREAKEKGKAPYLNVEYTITEEEYQGRKVWEVLSWSPKALFRMRDFFRAAGFEDDEYDLDVDEESNLLIEPDLTGEAVVLTLENEIYNKKEINRVVLTEFVNPPGTGEDEEEEEEEEAPPPKKASKKKAAPAVEEEEDEEEEEDDEEDEEEEEEEEAPPVKKKIAPTKATEKRSFRPTTTGAKKSPTGKKRTFR